VAKRPPIISDTTWQAIKAAAAPFKPDKKARSELRKCIKDYFGMQRDPAQMKRARDLWRRRAKEQVSDAAISYAERQVTGWDRILREYRGHGDPAREYLFGCLFDVWRWHFGGTLTVTKPPLGGPPSGPLVNFITAVFKHVLGEDISPDTILEAVRREKRRATFIKRKRKRRKSKPPL